MLFSLALFLLLFALDLNCSLKTKLSLVTNAMEVYFGQQLLYMVNKTFAVYKQTLQAAHNGESSQSKWLTL